NSLRSPENRLRITSPETAQGYPIEAPTIYNPEILSVRMNNHLQSLDESLKKILLKQVPFPKNPPMDDQIYLKATRKLDTIYQLAARYKMFEPYRSQMRARKKNDVRGYYFL